MQYCSMLLHGLFLRSEVTICVSVLRIQKSLVFNITAGNEKGLFFLLQALVCVFDLNSKFSIASLLKFTFLPGVVVFCSDTFVVPSQRLIFAGLFVNAVLATACLPLSLIKCGNFVAKIMTAGIDNFLDVFNFCGSAGKLVLKLVKLIFLVVGLNCLALTHLLKTSDFSPHLATLDLDCFDLTLKVAQLVS